jgi:hypothetical protein
VSVVGKLLGEAGAGAARGLMDGIGDLGDKVKSWITGEPNAETKAKLETLWLEIQEVFGRGQLAINEAEARSTSIFVAGWRPFIGWVCGIAMAWNYVAYPMVIWAMAIWRPGMTPPPQMSLSEMWPVLLGMLGLGAFRSYEKKEGVHGRH